MLCKYRTIFLMQVLREDNQIMSIGLLLFWMKFSMHPIWRISTCSGNDNSIHTSRFFLKSYFQFVECPKTWHIKLHYHYLHTIVYFIWAKLCWCRFEIVYCNARKIKCPIFEHFCNMQIILGTNTPLFWLYYYTMCIYRPYFAYLGWEWVSLLYKYG